MYNMKECSSKQEKLIADALGWEVVKGSGSRPTRTGDVVGDRWLGECKTHMGGNHPVNITYDVWQKIKKEAIAKFKFPVLFVDDGSQQLSQTWCILPNIAPITSEYREQIEDYPFPIKKNLRFWTDALATWGFDRPNDPVSPIRLCKAEWNGETCYVVSFAAFQEMFG